MGETISFRLAANRWVIKARWFYMAIVVVAVVLLKWRELAVFSWGSPDAYLASPLPAVLFLALLLNILLQAIAGMIQLETAGRHMAWLSFLQMATEISLITMLLFDLPAGESYIPVLYFIPIVESIMLFGRFGPLVVSILIGVILNAFIIFSNWRIIQVFLAKPILGPDGLHINSIFTWSLILSVVYLIIGSLSSYVAKLINSHELELEREATAKEGQMKSLKDFNRQLEKEERAIKAKDYELEVANDRLRTLEDAKSKFVSVTAHQLRTPLSAIKWTFEMMVAGQLGPITDEQKEFLAKGFEGTKRMIRIVNDLMHVDNMEAEKIEYQFAPFSLDSLLDTVSFEFANQAASKKITLDIKKPVSSLPLIEGDENKLRIVLENLIDNAVKYTDKDGKVTVEISDDKVNTANRSVEVSISDSGIGIPEADKSKIFGKFFRAGNAIRMEPDGSGIGLYLSKDIVEKHGGSLSYESNEGGGTTFHLTLPLKQART